MQFAYEGFTQKGDCRSFRFSSRDALDEFSIAVNLSLLTKYGVLMQDGPQFCLHLLEIASAAEPDHLDRFHTYNVMSEDFRPLLVERARKLAEKAMKTSMRRTVRKPPARSNLFLGHAKADQ